MKHIYGITHDGEIYAVCQTEVQARNIDDNPVDLVPNCTWNASDYTDNDGRNWISVQRLAESFRELVKKTGMKKKSLAEICGKSAVQFSKYLSGESAVPVLVWEKVAQFKR